MDIYSLSLIVFRILKRVLQNFRKKNEKLSNRYNLTKINVCYNIYKVKKYLGNLIYKAISK